MGKGFQNFMSKKDFHPSAWWNLKKVWEARQKKEQLDTRETEMRTQYEKEQEIFNNKALLGDEKAKMGLSFMYEAPAGINKQEEEKPEPKFEWQRKYNAPRESWAQNNDNIVDHPFGIAVRNVRCVRCHNWGHVNTDNECPLYGKSGNYEEEGFANNPSDLVKELRKAEKSGKAVNKNAYLGRKKKVEEVLAEGEEEWIPADSGTLAEKMREEHGMKLKASMLSSAKEFEQLEQMGNAVKVKQEETSDILEFFNSLSEKDKKKLMRKTLGLPMGEKESKKSKRKEKKEKKKRKKLEKKMRKAMKIKKEEPASDESENEKEKDKQTRHRRDSSLSPPPSKKGRRDSDVAEKRRIKEEPVSSDDEREQRRKRKASPARKRSPVRSPPRKRRDSRSPLRSIDRRRRDSRSPVKEKRRNEREDTRGEERRRSPVVSRRRDSRSPVRRRSRSPMGKNRGGEGRGRDSRSPQRKRSPVAQRRRESRTPEKKREERKEKENVVMQREIKEEPVSEDEYERREKERGVAENGGERGERKRSNSSSSSSSSSSSDSSDSSDDEKKTENKRDVAHEYRGKFCKSAEGGRKSPEKEKRRDSRSPSPPSRRRRSISPRRRSRSPRRR